MAGLCLTADVLEVHELANVRVDEDVVAPARPPQLESERFREPSHVSERDVRNVAASKPREEPFRIHVSTPPHKADTNSQTPRLDGMSNEEPRPVAPGPGKRPRSRGLFVGGFPGQAVLGPR